MADETRTRTFRVADDIWQAAMEKAADRDEKVSDILRAALHDYTKCTECACEFCGLDTIQVEDFEAAPDTAVVWGTGRFSETSNPDVAALIERAKELLAEGAVGVSVSLDLDPADMPANPADVTDEQLDNAHMRIRHVAIVDTPAFSGAYLDLAADGSVSGPLVFEGVPTGDMRGIGFDQLTLDDSLLPIPIIFDLQDGDHTGVTVGYIDGWEKRAGTLDETAPLVASASTYPAYLFAEPEPTAMTIHEPDSLGFRRYSGIVAPTNVCHKGMGGCYTYRGADLGYFHSGARVALDDGTFTRVGPLVFGGLHADAQKLDYAEALSRTDDARRVFAMGRMFHHPKGLLFSGVLMPDADIPRIQATAPSVELWPNQHGKLEVKTALQVNRPAFPVAASVGNGVLLVDAEPVELETTPTVTYQNSDPLSLIAARVEALEKVTGELFAAHLSSML